MLRLRPYNERSMPTLILALPFAAIGLPEYDYVLTHDGRQATAQGRSVAAMLPAARGAERVAVVPARALSWHSVTLPERVLRSLLSARTEPARARGVLAGVLEEQLLDDPEQLHFAVFAAPAGPSDQPDQPPKAWVAACNRAWLHSSLQALEATGHAIDRLVAEATPTLPDSPQARLSSELQPAQLLLCTPQGVSLLPLQAASLALALTHAGLPVFAEPAVMALATQHFGSQAILQTRSQALLLAAQSSWNLAQLELSVASGRWRKRLAAAWHTVSRSPAWRPVRWGVLGLLLLQVVALNALAWQQRSRLEEKRAAIRGVLQQSFPEVQLVIDAPLQMQRAVDDLARAHGAGSQLSLTRVLTILSPLASRGLAFSAIEANAQQVQLNAPQPEPGLAADVAATLDAQGLRAQWQGNKMTVTLKESR
jgi:general secretion pathway protein L